VLKAETAWAQQPLDSLTASSFQPLFDEFRGKRFVLLRRGSRDGFDVRDFHKRCDGQANTLTVIFEKKGNVFGGFTLLEWESPLDWNLGGTEDNRERSQYERLLRGGARIAHRSIVIQDANRWGQVSIWRGIET
jgi:hypothetical protein